MEPKLAALLEPCQEKASSTAEVEDALLGLGAESSANERELSLEHEPRSRTTECVDLQFRPVFVLPFALRLRQLSRLQVDAFPARRSDAAA
jgi:hypothetical protein